LYNIAVKSSAIKQKPVNFNEFRLYSREENKASQTVSNNEERALLTDRQREILMMVAEGKTYKEVGEIIGLKERTIKYHMGKMLEYLHLENRSQVIAYASRNRIFDDKG